jgi:methylmalonyl-CoA/ethylmalonyl-CoA epimerase
MSLRVRGFGQIAIVCQDVARATAFYRDVLGVPFLFSAGPNLAFLQLGEVRLMLTVNENPDFSGTSTLYFRVEDLRAAWEALRPHATLLDEPHLIADMGDHDLWMAFFKDTEGNAHGLMEERRK